ncbi:hypothetical protein N0V83_008740 [Neocucurbitaria cava]|uniref:Rhodopsin domain-containing protein n=1 Tax=Neocucurbitaria cava TaxID=798079 RepID=A0A9W8Y121_9PLEO|nr:hypothetical protein N0V83_008740 [Neocucurbitaria cava]
MLYLGLPNIEQYLLVRRRGRPQKEPTIDQSQFFYLEHNFYVSESSIIKISLLLQYLRIFKAGPMRWTCIALLGLVSIWGLGFFFVAWFPCFPVRGSWERTIGAKCYGFGLGDVQSFIALFKIFSASNMAFDLAIFLTPLVLFRTPNLRMKTIVAMVGLFAFGALVVSMSVWRLYGITATRAGTFPYLDFTWLTPPMIIASCLEIDLAIICASMPIFWPMIEKSLAAIFVSYELEIVEERVDDQGLVYEMEHMGGREGSLKSSGTSTQELTNEEDEEGGAVRRVYTVGPDPLNDEARAGGFKADVRSKPKPKWAL